MFRKQLLSRLPALCVAIVAGAALGLSLVCLFVKIRWDDQSFALYVAPRLLDGYRLYGTDIMELQPPLIFWMTMIPALLARSINTTMQVAFILCLFVLTCAIMLWSLRLSSASDRERRGLFEAGLACVLMYVAIILPSMYWRGGGGIRYDFGQREHIMALLILPYLFSVARRLDRRHLSPLEAVFAGVTAAIGFGLKPQYLFIAICVEALLIYQMRGFRHWVRPELTALLLGGLCYCLLVWLFATNYLTDAAPFFAQAYGDFASKNTLELIYQPTTGFLALLAAALVWRARGESQALVFLLGGMGAFVAFVLQHKGWSDHLLPVQMLLILSISIAATNQVLRWLNSRLQTSRPSRAALAAVAMLSCLISFEIYYPIRASLSAESERENWLAEINRATAAFQPGTAFLALTDGIDIQFNLANDRGFVWASRYPCLVLPAATLKRANTLDGEAKSTDGYLMLTAIMERLRGKSSGLAQEKEYVRKLRSDVLEDILRWKPRIVLVRRCDAEAEPCTFGDHFDAIGWLSPEPGFSAIWSNYRLTKRLKKYDLYILSQPA
jgi:hypothetical protein